MGRWARRRSQHSAPQAPTLLLLAPWSQLSYPFSGSLSQPIPAKAHKMEMSPQGWEENAIRLSQLPGTTNSCAVITVCLLACLFHLNTWPWMVQLFLQLRFPSTTFRAFPLKKYFFVCVFFPKLKHFKSRLSLHSCILYCWGPLQIIQFSYFVLAQSKFQCHELMLDCLFLKESPINEAVITDVERDWFWFPCFDFILYTVSSVPSFLSQFIIPHFINIQPNDMLGETLGNSKCRLMLRSHVQGGQPAPRAALVGLVFPGLLRRESSFQVKGMKS